MQLFRSGFTLALLLAFSLGAFSQSSSIRIANVSEPPELIGEPKKLNQASEADRQLFDIVGHLKDEAETKSTLPKLDDFIAQHPDNSDAYFLRTTCAACILNSRDFASISNDVKAAISHSPKNIYNDTDYYSLLGKIAFVSAQYGQAADDLERAMSRDLGARRAECLILKVSNPSERPNSAFGILATSILWLRNFRMTTGLGCFVVFTINSSRHSRRTTTPRHCRSSSEQQS